MAETSSIDIRLARREDSERIAQMSRDLIEAGLGWNWRAGKVRHWMASPEATVIVAEAAGRMAGFAIMTFADASAHLALLAVDPAWRRRGIAVRLINWLEDSCRVAGIGQINLEVRVRNRSAQAFYQSLGYREAGIRPGYYAGREDAMTMSHRLIPEEAESGRP